MTARRPVPGETAPQPRLFRAQSGDTLPDFVVPRLDAPGSAADGEAPAGRPRRGRLRRRIRRTLAVLVALIFLAVAVFGSLLLVTPSARQAMAIVRARDRGYGVGYPGPPVPARFAASLVATGVLSQAQANAALAQPLRLVPRQRARAAPGPGTPTCGRTRT
jgi:hypothetical protein